MRTYGKLMIHFSRYNSRRGVTLIELLVVILMLTVLAALLLSALMRARTRARQVACLARMRELGHGMHQFTTANNGLLPNSGTFEQWHGRIGWGSPLHSWVVDLLPYTAPAVADKWEPRQKYAEMVQGTGGGYLDGGNSAISNTHQEWLVCPANFTGRKGGLSYVVNGGANLWWGDPRSDNLENLLAGAGYWMDYDGDGQEQDDDDRQIARSLGLLWPGTPLRNTPHDVNRPVDSIPDGTSQTILLSENLHSSATAFLAWWSLIPNDFYWQNWGNPDPNFVAFRISDDICPQGNCAHVNWSLANSDKATDNLLGLPEKINSVLDRSQLSRSLPNNAPQGIKDFHWPWPYPSSYHPGGVNVVFADGHGRLLSEHIDGLTYAKLVSPAGSRIPRSAPVYQAPLDDASY